MADMDPWNPGNEDPYWMLEIRQGFDDAGSWLKNDRTFSVTRDPIRAMRYPSRFEAQCARSRLPLSETHRFEPTEHAWIASRPPVSDDALVEQSCDSGMSGEAIALAEQVWANLPTGNRSWTSLATHEKALVCHTLAALTASAERERELREALERARTYLKANGYTNRDEVMTLIGTALGEHP